MTILFTAFTTEPATQTVTVHENWPTGEAFTVELRANSAPSPTLTVAGASGPYRGAADLSATLGGCADVADRPITFTLATAGGSRDIGATTDDAGVATVSAAELTTDGGAIPVGTYGPTGSWGVLASFAGADGCAAVAGAAALTVTPRTPTITFTAPTAKTYGDAPFALGVSSSAGDDLGAPALTLTYAPATVCDADPNAAASARIVGAGRCTITASQSAGANANYADATAVAHTFDITKATPVIAWELPAAITYGAALSAAQLGASAGFGGVPLAGSYRYSIGMSTVSVGTVLPAGGYQLGVTFTPTDGDNYASATGEVALTVDKAPLAVTAKETKKVYGVALPTFEVTYGLFVNGDTVQTALGGSPTFATLATASSPVGRYDVTPGGLTATNYRLDFVSGSLIVEPAPLTITAEDQSRRYGAAEPQFTVTYGPFVLGEGSGVLGGSLACATEASSTSSPGQYRIDCAGLLSANYVIEFRPGTLTIEKADQTITFVQPLDMTLTAPPVALSASANSGLTVSFATAPEAPCTVSGAIVTPQAPGLCTIVASQPGDPNHHAAPDLPRSFTITAAPEPTPGPSPSTSPSPTPSPIASPSPTPLPGISPSPIPSPSPMPLVSPLPSPATYLLTLTTTGAGTATPALPGPQYPAGMRVAIVAGPVTDALFLGWTVDGEFQGWHSHLTVEMRGDRQVRAEFAPRATFCDSASQPAAAEALAQLAARGIIRGYGDGCFGPNDPILRAQLAGMIVRAQGWESAASGPASFADQGGVDGELWRAVGYLASRGVARGYEDGTYRPLDPVLHIQALSFVTRSMVAQGYWQLQPDNPTLAPEIADLSGHRRDYATYIHYVGGVPGAAPDGGWGGAEGWDQPATRAWFAQLLWRALAAHWGEPRET